MDVDFNVWDLPSQFTKFHFQLCFKSKLPSATFIASQHTLCPLVFIVLYCHICIISNSVNHSYQCLIGHFQLQNLQGRERLMFLQQLTFQKLMIN